MITELHKRGWSSWKPKSDYVIFVQPLRALKPNRHFIRKSFILFLGSILFIHNLPPSLEVLLFHIFFTYKKKNHYLIWCKVVRVRVREKANHSLLFPLASPSLPLIGSNMVLSVFVGILYLYLYGNQSFLFLLVHRSLLSNPTNSGACSFCYFVYLLYFSYSFLFSFVFYLFLSFIEFKMMLFVFAVSLSFYLYLN